VCLPAVSVITSISFDHMKQLGNTLAEIAREKAGIVKPGVPIVSGVLQPEPQAVIAEVAREHGCRLIQTSIDFSYEYQAMNGDGQGDKETTRQGEAIIGVSPSPCLPLSLSDESPGTVNFDYRVPGQELSLRALPLAMRGPHQAANAAVALAAISELRHQGWCISTDAMRTGLASAKLPGRVEVIPGELTVVLDAAHNPASARALVAALAEMPMPSRRTLVLSISHDKDVGSIVGELVPHFDRFVVTQYQENPRAVHAEDLAAMVRQMLAGVSAPVCVFPTPQEAWLHVCQTAIPDEQACITGSFYLAAEMRRMVLTSKAAVTAG
jgi:dihydrofolate synthase/folylpolyglutamate synthase